MKNALLGIAVIGIAYLVFKDYKRSKKPCSCKDKMLSATDKTVKTTEVKPQVMEQAVADVAMNMDGWGAVNTY